MPEPIIIKGKYTDAIVYATLVEDGVLEQLQAIVDAPFTEGEENRLFYTSFPPALATGYIYLKSAVLTA